MNYSISKIKLFKSCRRAYELKYVEGLQPIEMAEPLQTGIGYHERLESLYDSGIIENDFSKESAMAEAYRKHIFPLFEMDSVEQWVSYPLPFGNKLIGRIDGMTTDDIPVEHKTTGRSILEAYEYSLQWDEQILAYMLATGSTEMIYTVCRKPTIRQKQSETDEDFYRRMIEWYDVDTDDKIKLLQVSRTKDELIAFRNELDNMIIEMRSCKNYYKNTSYCEHWGRRCEYSAVCLNYDPSQNYIEFTKETD